MNHALLIGINYVGTSNELKNCINDVENMKKILIEKYGFKEENITLMTDNTNTKPTKANIIIAIKKLCSTVGSLFFHYSGHGVVAQGGRAINTLSVQRGNTRQTEMICPLDFTTAGMIYDHDLRSFMDTIPASSYLTAIMDCCHSEDIFSLTYNVEISLEGKCILSKIASLSETTGKIILLSACRSDEVDEDGVSGDGALTASLLHLLDGSDITCQELLEGVSTYFRKEGFTQLPCMSFGRYQPLSSAFIV